jgi:hypothetical protein
MKTAMGRDPSMQQASGFNPDRLQRRINYLQKRNPNDPRLRNLRNRLKTGGGRSDFERMSPEQQAQQLAGTSGQVFEQMAGYAQGFDPSTMQSQYDPIYSQEMERARQNVMGQFERQMAPEFQRQQEQFQQMAAERGLDPNSVAYKTQLQQLNERQDAARQQAISSAEQAAQGVQQTMFSQAGQMAMMPGQIVKQFMTPYEYQQKMLQLQSQQQAEAEQGRLDRQSREQIARIGASAANQGPTPYDKYIAGRIAEGYGGGQQPNPMAGFAGGFAGGFGRGIFGGSQ